MQTNEDEPRRKRSAHQDERAKIEALHKAGLTHQAIADIIGCCRSAITRELKKGQVEHLDYKTWIVSKVYDAYAAQQTANYQKTAHSKGLKLGNNHACAALGRVGLQPIRSNSESTGYLWPDHP